MKSTKKPVSPFAAKVYTSVERACDYDDMPEMLYCREALSVNNLDERAVPAPAHKHSYAHVCTAGKGKSYSE